MKGYRARSVEAYAQQVLDLLRRRFQSGGSSATSGMRGTVMTLPSPLGTSSLRCRLSGEPAIAPNYVVGALR